MAMADDPYYQQIRENLLKQLRTPPSAVRQDTNDHLRSWMEKLEAESAPPDPEKASAEFKDAIERMKQLREERRVRETYTMPSQGPPSPLGAMVSGVAHKMPSDLYNVHYDAYDSESKTRGGRRHIRSVSLDISHDDVQISDLGGLGSRRVQGPEYRVWKDHNGERLPRELTDRLEHVLRQNDGVSEHLDRDIQRVLDIWNNDDRPLKRGKRITVAPTGHKRRCLFNGDHDHPCTCQPTTLWADAELWLCDCCNEPRATIRFGLCDLCEHHQYADGHNAEIEHDARRQSE